ncbi:MAG: Uma2 family endonuclease [Spirochaetia bacterium]|nr:Uma2 family endonuclease [Spirochaetia bacterium]
MNTVIQKITIPDYLDKERKSLERTEYVNGEELKMTGASYIHNCIVVNLLSAIKNSLNSEKFKVLSNDMKVWIPSKNAFFYPDILVLPIPPQFHDESNDIVTNPICIFEVLSDSTRNFDKGEKFDSYRSITRFQEYYLVEQNKKLVSQYFINANGNWELIEFTKSEATIPLKSLEIQLGLSEIYEGIEF